MGRSGNDLSTFAYNVPGGNRTPNCPLGGGRYIHLTTGTKYCFVIHLVDFSTPGCGASSGIRWNG